MKRLGADHIYCVLLDVQWNKSHNQTRTYLSISLHTDM